MMYDKYPYFDQWNGHSWATGASPGRAGDVEDGKAKDLSKRKDPNPWSIWSSYGTGNDSYDHENENSSWEGLQAFSAILLWGAENKYSWCPVATGSQPASGKGGGNSYAVNTGYVDSNPEAFYGEASAGCSILQKGSPSLNNFFYAYPTGSKFIQAFPPTPWTMGMSRGSDYMKKWAEAMTRDEWKKARESALFQPGNWLGLAMTSALCGVPYNPGDNQENVDQYVERLWSSWIVNGTAPGSQATMQPADQATSVLNFLHTLDVYGPPDWSIYAKAVNAKGEEVDDIVFTAAFSKIDEDTKEVITTFVAFNPTWKPCYVHFVRIRSDGTLSDVPIHLRCDEKGRTTPIQVEPKKMTVLNSPWMGTALAAGGTDKRVYYLDADKHVIELAWYSGAWHWFDVTKDVQDAGGRDARRW